MTAIDTEAALERTERRRKIVRIAALAALGGLVGMGVGYLGADILPQETTPWQDQLAALVAVMLIASAAAGAVAVMLRKTTVSSGCAWLQVAAMVLAGAMLLIPMLGFDPAVSMGVVAALFAVQTAANLALWRIGDELLRRVIVETGALSFWGLQGSLFLYAAAERLALVPTISAWGLIGILMVAYVIASTVVAVRRGFS